MSATQRQFYCRAETGRHYRRAVERVIRAMHDHLDEEFSLDDMAAVAIMSPFHLNRVFRQLTGVPPCRFLTALRLGAAKRFLLTSRLSVTDISLEVGYNSLGTFTRRFTDLVGLSPGRFRALADTGTKEAVGRLRRAADYSRTDASSRGLEGKVHAPSTFSGPIFVGLFKTAIPQGRPVACALKTSPGEMRLPRVPDGRYYLVGVGLPWSLDQKDYLLYDRALRGGAVGSPVRIEGDEVRGRTDIFLRAPEAIDPPILITPPIWLAGLERPAVREVHRPAIKAAERVAR